MNNGLQYSNRKYWNILICKKSSGSKHKTIQKGQRLVAHFLFSNAFPSLGCFLSTSVSLYFSINQKEIHRRDLEVSVVEPKLTFISPYPYVNLRRVRSIKSCQLWCAWRVSKKNEIDMRQRDMVPVVLKATFWYEFEDNSLRNILCIIFLSMLILSVMNLPHFVSPLFPPAWPHFWNACHTPFVHIFLTARIERPFLQIEKK